MKVRQTGSFVFYCFQAHTHLRWLPNLRVKPQVLTASSPGLTSSAHHHL